MASVTGDKNHQRRLDAMRSPRGQQLITQALYVAGQTIELDAERSITAGSISGKGHVPSAPGQAPNADTRRLDAGAEGFGGIHTEVQAQGVVIVHADAPYAAVLEFGGSKVQERPFMRPAVARNRGKVSELVSKAVDKIIRDS